MRRVCLILVALALLICFTAVSAYAAETVASGSCGTSVNWVLTDDGTLTISGVGPMNGFIIGKQPWYDYRDQISTVVVGSGVTSIGNYSFYNFFDNISYVKISDTVTSIGNYAFYHCTGFSYIRLPDSLVSIGNWAFGGTSLVSVTVPESVSSIGAGAFNNCNKLISVVSLNPDPPAAGSYLFDNYEVLSRIMVPSGSSDSYKAASGWSPYAGFIQDGSIGVQTFSVSTSFNGQTIYLDQADTVDLYIMASGVSGTVSVDWYMGTTLVHSQDDLGFFDPTTAIGAWRYTPGGDSTRVFYAVVTHTSNGVSDSVTTDFVKIVVGSGDGSGSGDDVNDRLDQIDLEITEVKDAISEVNGKVDGISDQLDGVSDQIEESNGLLSDVVDGVLALPGKILDGIVGLFVPDAETMAAQQEMWNQLLADRFGAVYEAGEIVTEITDVFTLQDAQTEIQFPSVTIPFGEVDWTFGGWTVDVVPDGFEFLIEVLKKILDIVCTLAFVNAMKIRFDRTLEERA